MTLLGHNDAHCIVLYVKYTPSCRPGLRSALASRPEIRERHPRPSRLSLVFSCPAAVFLSSLYNALRDKRNERQPWSFLDALSRSIHGTEKVGDVSGRRLAIPHHDDRFAIPLNPSSLKWLDISISEWSRSAKTVKLSLWIDLIDVVGMLRDLWLTVFDLDV